MGQSTHPLLLIKRPRLHASATAVALTEAVALTAEAVPEAVASTAEAVAEAVAVKVEQDEAEAGKAVVGTPLVTRRTVTSSHIC